MRSEDSKQQKQQKQQKPPKTKAGQGNPKLTGENRPAE